MDFNLIFEKLLDFYHVSTAVELAQKMQITQQTISGWRSRNSINAVKKKCRELGIYDEIFKDKKQELNENYLDHVQHFIDEEQRTADGIDLVTYIIFKELYQDAAKKEDLKNLRMYLLNFESSNS